MADDDPAQAQQVPDSDIDGHAAKRHGDYFLDVNDPTSALAYYQEALNKGDLDAVDTGKVHYDMASCYFQLGDQANCYPHAYEASKSSDEQTESFALKFFFWAVTGERIGGL